MLNANDLLRVYFPDEFRIEHPSAGPVREYPLEWDRPSWIVDVADGTSHLSTRKPPDDLFHIDSPYRVLEATEVPAIKDYVREQAGHRCVRCGHPYPPGIAATHPRGEWTPCDGMCTHRGEVRIASIDEGHDLLLAAKYAASTVVDLDVQGQSAADARLDEGPHGPQERWLVWAHYRILTVHHLNGVKWDCRWWNLAALCQRCHLSVQSRVLMDRIYPFEHTDWFKPYAAGYYASAYLGQELTREETMARLDELLALELQT